MNHTKSARRIGLVDVDGHNGFPNLALMRIAAWHKALGDTVEWWDGMLPYDRIYMSKVFTFSPDNDTVMQADEIIKGGTGYRDYGSLPEEIEAMPPDYSIYPRYPYAVGFLTRGCIRSCPWCIVPRKEGGIRPAAAWQEIKRPDSRTVKAGVCDQNRKDRQQQHPAEHQQVSDRQAGSAELVHHRQIQIHFPEKEQAEQAGSDQPIGFYLHDSSVSLFLIWFKPI